MHVARLTLDRFRNHPRLTLATSARLIALTGANGAGKTSLLEAVSLLAPGRGLRGAALPDMAQRGGDGGFVVRSSLDTGTGTPGSDAATSLATGITVAAPTRRVLRVNDADQPQSALAEWCALLWVTPALDRLFVEPASVRRRFLDRMTLALAPAHGRHATRYDSAMRARTRLLAGDGAAADARWLTALEAQMAEHGSAVAAARAELVAQLGAQLDGDVIDGFARPALALADNNAWQPETLAAALHASRPRDAAAGRALTGPHRQDLFVTHRETAMPAAHCSTGEQKALLLSIVMAHGDAIAELRGARPILLLDEVAAHLDPTRRAALFARLHAGGGQVWMTGTEGALFDALPAGSERFDITPGAALPC